LDRRAAEAAAVRDWATTALAGDWADRPLLVCGDLNDTPEAATTQLLFGPPGVMRTPVCLITIRAMTSMSPAPQTLIELIIAALEATPREEATSSHGTPLCQDTAGRAVLGWLAAGPGSGLSEEPIWGCESAALESESFPRCPPGPVASRLFWSSSIRV
jgi:hypothetical protein